MSENTKAFLLLFIAGISALIAVISVFIAYKSYSRLSTQDLKKVEEQSKKDLKEETKTGAAIETKLDYISKGLDDIKLDNRDQGRTITNMHAEISDMKSKLSVVEDSTKSAHKRIDEILK